MLCQQKGESMTGNLFSGGDIGSRKQKIIDYKIREISTILIQTACNLEVQRSVGDDLESAPLAKSYMII